MTVPLQTDPGSARARYAAAMALHARGGLTDAQLEAYREAAAFDHLDPARTLRDRDLPVPDPQPPTPQALLHLLLDVLDRLLQRTPGDGAAEVRTRLGPAYQSPCTLPVPHLPPVMATHLPAALAAIPDPQLAAVLAATVPLLHWHTYDAYDPARIGPAFLRGHAFASLVGENAPFAAQDFDLGLFLIAPRTLYRDHAHAAPELYLPLNGPHRWRFAPGAAWTTKPALAPVWNPAFQPHATLTGDVPLLTLFGWTADVNEPAHVLDAPDWAEWER